ncbi:hypothetical protein DFS33DRAFT_1339246 [Desarmillaria ectypa]|nr:hypothetical protein DFS33DRAFT_1339246 [Desarmillaria ectypa]
MLPPAVPFLMILSASQRCFQIFQALVKTCQVAPPILHAAKFSDILHSGDFAHCGHVHDNMLRRTLTLNFTCRRLPF